MTLLETILMYFGLVVVFLFFIAFVKNCLDGIKELEKRAKK